MGFLFRKAIVVFPLILLLSAAFSAVNASNVFDEQGILYNNYGHNCDLLVCIPTYIECFHYRSYGDGNK